MKIQEKYKKNIIKRYICFINRNILLGNRENIDDEIISNFKDANIAHFISCFWCTLLIILF